MEDRKIAIITPSSFNEDYSDYKCSNCCRDGLETFFKFCPDCGAKLQWELPEDTTPLGVFLKTMKI